MPETQSIKTQQAIDVGRCIRQQRFAAGLSQQELGCVARVDRGKVASWEHGLRLPSGGQLVRMAKWLELRWVPADLPQQMQTLRQQQKLRPEYLARLGGVCTAALQAFEAGDGDLGYSAVHAIWLALGQPAWEPAAELPAEPLADDGAERPPTPTKRSLAARHGWQRRLRRQVGADRAVTTPPSHRLRRRKQMSPQRAAVPSDP